MTDKVTKRRNEREEELKEKESGLKSNVKSISKMTKMLKAANKTEK